MNNTAMILGVLSLVAGTCFWVVAIFRTLGHIWTLGAAELWLLPTAGIGFIVLGLWLLQ